jgi:hypothetical protein
VLSETAEDRFTVDMSELAASLDVRAWAERVLALYAHGAPGGESTAE